MYLPHRMSMTAALLSAADDSGSAPPAPSSPPVSPSADAAPKKASEPKAKAPRAPKPPKPSGEIAYMIWAQPGHPDVEVGAIVKVRAESAQGLNAAGRARHASVSEIEGRSRSAFDLTRL